MGRKLINPNQTQGVRTYYDHNNVAVIVHADGVIFSDDKEMDATVEFFKKQYGFVEAKETKKTETAAEKKAREKAEKEAAEAEAKKLAEEEEAKKLAEEEAAKAAAGSDGGAE